jgi:predicted membrane protein
MIERIEMIRWRQVERLNGRTATWWHYNRMTLVILLSAILALAVLLQTERYMRRQAEADARVLAVQPWALSCYSHDRATSLIIAGGSRKAVDEALMQAAIQADLVRGSWFDARNRWWDAQPAPKQTIVVK